MPLLLAQVVLVFAAGGEPVRFGAPVPERVLQSGLSLRSAGSLQWRPLPLPARDGRCWVEIAAIGAEGRARLQLGRRRGAGAGTGAGRCMDQATDVLPAADGGGSTVTRTEWRWSDGTIDRRRRTVFAMATTVAGEEFTAGEALTEDGTELAVRLRPLLSLPRALWTDLGLLPPDRGLAAPVRAHLQRAAAAMVELPGARGCGDYGRSGGVVTNLEFDTTLALLRLALALGDEALLLRARRAAQHLCDRDLDAATGLPFAHGDGHRTGTPQPGHVWLQGLMWIGALCAEDDMVRTARQIARGLASTPPMGEGADERARDYAWPLLELESYLTFVGDRIVERAADRLALAIAQRYRPQLRTFCFGEGEQRGPGYFERGWLTGGLVLPALRAHLRRRPDRELQTVVDEATAALSARIGQGRDGLPTHWRIVPGATFAEHRAVRDPKAFLLLEALPPRDLGRLLRRGHVLAGLLETPALDDPDLATSVSMAARCSWVYR